MANTLHVEKPWGFFDQFTFNEISTVKIITVKPNQQLSLQSHQQRDEMWVTLDKGLIGDIADNKIGLTCYQQIFISKRTKHRLINNSDHDARVLEISFGHFDESDIIRYEDKYGRV